MSGHRLPVAKPFCYAKDNKCFLDINLSKLQDQNAETIRMPK